MVGIGRTSHAVFFDGVSDSILIPQGRFTNVGQETPDGTKSPMGILNKTGHGTDIHTRNNTGLCIEAWVVPDCGGVIAHREGQFTLEFGTVDTPGPAKFSALFDTPDGIKKHVLSSAVDATTRWDGIVFPEQEVGGIHDSYNRYDTTNYNDATNLNFKHRPLYHIVAGVTQNTMFMFVNGKVIANETIETSSRLTKNNNHIFIGGEGGEFRGAMEAIHFSKQFDINMVSPSVPLVTNDTTGLYRFEEPIDVISESYQFTALGSDSSSPYSAASDGTTTTITISTTNAQSLASRLTGTTQTSGTVTFTDSPYSMGNYKVIDYYTSPGSKSTLAIPHTPYNLLINPGAINRNTHKPNQSPPERVRLESINVSTGVLTLSSIHLDFINGTNGKRGLLHSRTANVDDYFVVVASDLLIDNGTGKPYLPPHYNSQIIDRTGQMVLDETALEQHALMYSSRMATTANSPDNPFAVTWPSDLDELYQIGHSGRHTYSHVKGHEYMRKYPNPTSITIDQQISGAADIVEMSYDNITRGVNEFFIPNALSDFYDLTSQMSINAAVNSSPASFVVSNGLPESDEQLIAIGGTSFDYRPFMLKGPVPEAGDINDDTRTYHIRPESESRIALLHVPTLRTTHNLAPYVEIHYNAIDLTGASMSKTTPVLLVEKTVPSGNYVLTGSTTVLDVIEADLADATKDSTLFSPGGFIELSRSNNPSVSVQTSHNLVGDNTGGAEVDNTLDFSRCPVNYTPPSDASAEPMSPPTTINASHNSGVHNSVYHKLCIEGTGIDNVTLLTQQTNLQYIKPPEVENTGAGVFDKGGVNEGTPIHEMFDIIDNIYYEHGATAARIYIQPSNKNRVNQLAKIRDGITKGHLPNIASVYFLMSRTRIRSVKQETSQDGNVLTYVTAAGISEELINENVNITGSGSPDSHIVKEIEPNSPVVTVTLGGPGQGAVNTKPTYDPSSLMRLPGSTRRNCAVKAHWVDTTANGLTMSVTPLNNFQEDITSWGTYCFPKVGRIYLEDGSSAAYVSKNGTGFSFSDTTAIASGTYLLSNGTPVASFHKWCNATNIIQETSVDSFKVAVNVFNDSDFVNENLCDDGSTVNDRLFQSMDTVNHDYQLGTQFASTRAMVEIPIFPQQFFEQTNEGVFPGPDNSMKLHLDATYTAHTWNPSPVGKRVTDTSPGDRESNSAYSYLDAEGNLIRSATITQIVKDESDNTPPDYQDTRYKIFISHPKIFQKPDLDKKTFRNHLNFAYLPTVYLSNGDFASYSNDVTSDGFITVTANSTDERRGGLTDSSFIISSEGFIAGLQVGAKIFTSSVSDVSKLIPISSDSYTESSDFEGRRVFHHDSANMLTQGGNLDYGLRQYVSAVEFKSGPLDNPHSPRIVSKRAKSKILGVSGVLGTLAVLHLEDASIFPDPQYTLNASNVPVATTGDMIYVCEVMKDTPVEVILLGNNYTAAFNLDISENSVLVFGATLTDVIGHELRLKKVGRNHLQLSDPANADGYEETVSTFRPSTAGQIWTYAANFATSVSVVTISPATATLYAHANTVGLNVRPGDTLYLEEADGDVKYVGQVDYVLGDVLAGGAHTIQLKANVANAISSGEKLRVGIASMLSEDPDAILNRTWYNPYASGGLRNGDTVWMNMTMNNPHAVEGLFCKSRGVLNEGQVYTDFNGGEGILTNRPRDSIPLENFLIGDSSLETAINFAQHVNRTIELNYLSMGLLATQAPTVAYVDPYLATDGHARVLLFDVAHDREFIAFHDLHMQVQSSAATPIIGHTRKLATQDGGYDLDVVLANINGGAPHYLTTQIDVANGFPSENKFIRNTQQSKFIESAYAHDLANKTSKDLLFADSTMNSVSNYLMENPLKSFGSINEHYMGKAHGHVVHTGLYHESTEDTFTVADSALPRLQPSVSSTYYAGDLHNKLRRAYGSSKILPFVQALKSHRISQNPNTYTFRDASTTFDTPDGTRVISAFLCLKGVRNSNLSLAEHEESRLQYLKHWTEMDFVRKLTIDFGEIGVKEGVTDIEAAAKEIVRLINQGGAKNGRTHARRPSHQYPGEGEVLDLTRIGVREDTNNPNKDPAGTHINADFAATGSTYDPSPWWSPDEAFNTHDRGSHMGYLRAHLGRVVEDKTGTEGFSIIIHSTVPGASGRNFCAWLDNSKGQSPYNPQFLIGHGGRFRNFWCQPDETMGENMHPAPMPINKHGRPFAPITTLREMVRSEFNGERISSNHDYGTRTNHTTNPELRNTSSYLGSGTFSNTINDDSFESQGPSSSLVEGLRVASNAIGRVNFGGMVMSGIPGWSPIASKWGLGEIGDTSFDKRYSEGIITGGTSPTALTSYSGYIDKNDVTSENVGDSHLYGMKMIDHRGNSYGVRYVYREIGMPYTNDNTIIPNTLENEIGIFFDDKDVSQGGFTIGQHMLGYGDVTGRIDTSGDLTEDSFRGNYWNPYPSPSVGIDSLVTWDSTLDTLTVVLQAPFHTGGSDISNHPDILGYLGFPATNGLIQVNDTFTGTTVKGITGHTLSYESRTQVDKSGTHIFYGVKGTGFTSSHYDNSGTITNTTKTHPAATGSTFNIRVLISPRINWTCLITDELMTAVTNAAINLQNPNKIDGTSFDCTAMLTADGRTFGEWGVSPDAIKIRAFNPDKNIRPISDMFESSIHPDLGIEAAHVEYGLYQTMKRNTTTQAWEITTGSEPLNTPYSDAEIDDNKSFNSGYIPTTILQITSKGRGYHANTPTPVIVDSTNKPIDMKKWTENLKGANFTSHSGDHIIPSLDETSILSSKYYQDGIFTLAGSITTAGTGYSAGVNHNTTSSGSGTGAIIRVTSVGGSGAVTGVAIIFHGSNYAASEVLTLTGGGGNAQVTVASILTRTLITSATSSKLYQMMIPAGQEGSTLNSLAKKPSFGERHLFYVSDNRTAILESANGAYSAYHLTHDYGNTNEKWSALYNQSVSSGGNPLNRFPNRVINGMRFYGSVDSEPITYFRGAKDSVDHSVPLYFGGGFSGVTLDINDGTQNDYSEFYTHPYSTGPTGTAGIQHANEISTSFANVDCNALLAFFPGTALLNQHRGSITSPVANKDNVLSTDIFAGTLERDANVPASVQAKYAAGVVRQKPTPMVLRFAHPTARYEDYKDGTESKSTYLIFGPGQAFPLAEKNTTAAGVFPSSNPEPHPGKVVTVGNSWSSVPAEMRLPNEIHNDAGYFGPPTSAYQSDRHKFHYKSTLNWSPAHGIPNYGKLKQRPEHGSHYGEHFNKPVASKIDLTNKADFFKAHPYKHCSTIYYGIAMSADLTFHMDGGYHPGGHWLDNQLAFNPPNPNSNYRVTSWADNVVNPTAFRVSGPMGAIYDPTSGSGSASSFNTDYILVDATRCQNGEELAAVLGQAINEYPGTGALKAMGGTFLPSMGNSMRQDRYGWVQMTVADFTSDYGIDESGTFANMIPFQNGESMGDGTHSLASSKTYVIARFGGGGRELHEQIPACGWLRTPDGGRDNGPALTATCNTNHTSGLSDGSSTSVRHITHVANSNIVVGLYVKGTGVPDGSIITAINTTTCFTISADTTATSSGGTTLTFTNLNVPMFAPYHSREVYNDSGTYKVKFYLAPNRVSGFPLFEDAKTFYDICETNSPTFPMPGQTITGTGVAMATPTRLFVWSKAGVHRFNNETETTRDHMTQVHFSGLVDAIDRTRPVGAVGWAGERYSYLNSLKVSTSSFTNSTCAYNNDPTITIDSTANLTRGMFVSGTGIPTGAYVAGINNATTFELSASTTGGSLSSQTLTFTSNLYGAGLGAWHPKLGFSPYGSSNSCMNALGHIPSIYPLINSPEGNPRVNLVNGSDETIKTPYTWNVGLASTHGFYKSFTVGGGTYNNSTTITHTSSSVIVRGMGVSGSGIPANAFVSSITDATHFELSAATTGGSKSGQTLTFTPLFGFETSESLPEFSYSYKPIHSNSEFVLPEELTHPQGVYSRAFLVVSYESELPLVAKFDRDGIKATGDWLTVVSKTKEGVAAATAITFAGTSRWDERFHNAERYIAPANAGPNVEALIYANTDVPSDEGDLATNGIKDSTTITAELEGANILNAEPCHAKTGDLFFDLDESPGSINLETLTNVERNIINDFIVNSTSSDLDIYDDDTNFWIGDTNAYTLSQRSPIDNFSVEHVVWKRMDGGNLSLPAVNARGLGAVPFVTRVQSTNAYTTGEKIYGVNRFSFESTNSAMFPIIQAQELSHPQIASTHPDELRNVLEIPNEEIQFESISVIDDTGQVHTVEGGSPFGTIIRTFNQISDRLSEGLAPAISGSGVEPNLQIRLPDANAVPGNIVIRSGFDRLQGYQTETMGTGGMQRPKINAKSIGELFNIRYPNDDDTFTSTQGPRLAPFYSDHLWEHISQSASGEAFPDSTYKGWESATNNAPIETSYELHDRSLYFHVTKNGNTHTHKYPTFYSHSAGITNNDLTGVSFSGTTLTVNATVNASLFSTSFGDQERDTGTRRFLRLYNPTTDRGGVASFTGISGSTFTGCVGDVDFTELVAGSITTLKVVPSYYMPAGSTRFFAARRLRDHAEVSGNSPDMVNAILVGANAAASKVLTGLGTYQATELTPAPIPRMGHHFVNPTMAVLPGHWAHPAYQGLYKRHKACRTATKTFSEKAILKAKSQLTGTSVFVGRNTTRSGIDAGLINQVTSFDPMLYFSTINATPSGPSDVHGGGFTLMFESKIRYDGYGILASEGQAGVVNSKGGHTIVLEAAGTYSLTQHFPDPAEVGSYQIIIQPNILPNQYIGFHENGPAADVPNDPFDAAAGSVTELTTQQTALVIGIREIDNATGALGLVLANATMADVRGCEVFINEIMIDQDPDFGSQFTNIPPLLLYNPLGVQSSERPAFIKESLPYHPNMFSNSSPGFTLNIPWWSISHKVGPDDSSSYGYRHLSWHRMDTYYQFLRANAGSVAAQITLAGYPSTYPDIYSEINELVSVTPVCSVVSVTSTTITVDDARGFPRLPYYGEVLEYIDATGLRRTHTYTERSGYDATNMNKPKLFTFTAKATFTDNLTAGTKIRLSRMNDFKPAGAILKESKTSVMTRNLPQNLQGTRDTNSLHMADAFLCLWHPNLGRPHTYYSDSSRTWLSISADKAIDQKPLNSMPEHFETIHYHDATYFTSPGPFGFKIKTPKPSTVNNFTVGGVATTDDATITHNSCNMLVAGMTVSGTGVPVGATISSITSATEFELSAATTGGAETGLTFTFGNITVTLSGITGVRITHPTNGNIIVGSKVTGTNIPTNATVANVVNSTTFDLSVTPSSTPSGTLTIISQPRRFVSRAANAITTTPGLKFVAGTKISLADRMFTVSSATADTGTVITVIEDVPTEFNTRRYRGEFIQYGADGDGGTVTEIEALNTYDIFTLGSASYSDGTSVDVSSTTTLEVGMRVDGPDNDIPSGATIASITDGDTIVLSAATVNGSHSGQTLTFYKAVPYQAQAGTSTMLNHFWPCGSKGGPISSRLDGYGYVSSSWVYPRDYGYDKPIWSDADDDGSYTVSSGISKSDYSSLTNPTRPRPFGYRFSLRQPYNKPQWSTYGLRALRETAVTGTNASVAYQHGPLVQAEGGTWTYAGGEAGVSNPTLSSMYVGIMERQTNFSGMLNVDKPGYQVRYSDGMRFTRPFGCPIRTLRNASSVARDWWGDSFGKDISTVEDMLPYYVVDWWGNTRGEDVRRFPVRGFGIRPAWDAGDTYEFDRSANASPATRSAGLFNLKTAYNSADGYATIKTVAVGGGSYNNDPTITHTSSTAIVAGMGVAGSGIPTGAYVASVTDATHFELSVATTGGSKSSQTLTFTDGRSLPRFGGRLNIHNNGSASTLIDVFFPRHSLRVGDMGNGRGIRYPTMFNEDVLTALDEPYHATGIVLSHHTSEPNLNDGYLRARNDVLQNDEVPRGISARLEIDEDGLLKPEAVVSDRVENISGDSPHKDAISRSSPRIGIDTENLEGQDTNMIVVNTEAHSLHTDRNVGQRVILQGGMTTGSQTLTDYDLTSLSFAAQPNGGVMRMSHTSNFNPLGGIYVAETKNYLSPINDTDWGSFSDATCDYNNDPTIEMDSTAKLVVGMTVTGTDIPGGATVASITDADTFELSASTTGGAKTNQTLIFGPPVGKGSNPYVTNVFNSASKRANTNDKSISFMLKPVRLLDKQHVEMFRSNLNLAATSPQYGSNYFAATAGGRYGLYTYETTSGRATGGGYFMASTSPNTNAPYTPVYFMDINASDTRPISKGPKILGTGVSGYDSTTVDNEVTRVMISQNTLEHYRSDASRRRTFQDEEGVSHLRKDFSVQPRFSQSLHAKGHKGDLNLDGGDLP